jgi:hypothetical protein
LVGIAVNEPDRAVPANENVAFIYIADDRSQRMNRIEHRSAVASDVHKKIPIRGWEFSKPFPGAEELVDFLTPDERH